MSSDDQIMPNANQDLNEQAPPVQEDLNEKMANQNENNTEQHVDANPEGQPMYHTNCIYFISENES